MNARVGVGAFIIRDDKFIIGTRKGSHGSGTSALPGGHLEFGEDFESCAQREILEETGLEIENIRFLTATNDVMADEGKHYVTIFMGCTLAKDGEPEVLEPEKCEKWEWVGWDEIKNIQTRGDRTLFSPIEHLFKQRPNFEPVKAYENAV